MSNVSKIKAAKSRYSLGCFWSIDTRHTSDSDQFAARLVLLDAENNGGDESPYGGVNPVAWAFDLPRVKELDGLEFRSYIDKRGENSGRAWGGCACFDNVKVSEVHHAERILRVLRRVDAATRKLNDRGGSAIDLAQQFGRFCDAVGVEFVLKGKPYGERWASGYKYVCQTVGEAVHDVRNKMAEMYVRAESGSLQLVS